MAVFRQGTRQWVASVANITWGIGVEPKDLTDRTQMCFYIIPLLGGSGEPIAGGQTQQEKPRRPAKGRRGKTQKRLKEDSVEN